LANTNAIPVLRLSGVSGRLTLDRADDSLVVSDAHEGLKKAIAAVLTGPDGLAALVPDAGVDTPEHTL